MRNRIELTLTLEDNITFEMAFQKIMDEMNLILYPVNQILELLDLHRLTFEQKMLNQGLYHYEISIHKGRKIRTPRQRIYISVEDLLKFLSVHCSLRVELVNVEPIDFENKTTLKDSVNRKFKNVKRGLLIERSYIDNLDHELNKELMDTFIQGKWVSLSQLQERINRARSSALLLGRVVDSITFRLPGSQRTLRRYLFSLNIITYNELLKIVFKQPLIFK